MTPFRWLLLALAVAALAGVFWLQSTGRLSSLLRPESITQPQLAPLSGAIAERAIYEAQKMSAQDVSTTQPLKVTQAVIPLGSYVAESENPATESGDTDVHAVIRPATQALLVKLENEDVCYNGLCTFGLFANEPNQANPYAHPVLMLQARTVEFSSQSSHGNPDLIVDYGPPLGKRRLVWQGDSHLPDYSDAGPYLP